MTERETERETERKRDRQRDKTDRQTERQTDRQRDRHTEIKRHGRILEIRRKGKYGKLNQNWTKRRKKSQR